MDRRGSPALLLFEDRAVKDDKTGLERLRMSFCREFRAPGTAPIGGEGFLDLEVKSDNACFIRDRSGWVRPALSKAVICLVPYKGL